MAEITGQEITASESNDQQLPFSEDTTWTGRLRLRHSTRHESSKRSYDSDFSSSSSIRSESTRPQMGVSRAQSSVTTRSHLETFFSGPKLTKTGRISKAKKGVKDAHICRQCGKKYSRAEHMRRHEQNHKSSKLPCSWPDCEKTFSRQDLLDRHEMKHRTSGDCVISSGSESESERKLSVAATVIPNITTSTTCNTEPLVATMAEPYATQEEAIAPAPSQSASAAFSIKQTTLPSGVPTEVPLVSWIDEATLAASEYDAIGFVDGRHPSSGALSPWLLSTFSASNLFSEPLLSFSTPSLDPWSTLASDSISLPASFAPGIWMEPHPGPAGPSFPSSLVSSPSLHAIPCAVLSLETGEQNTNSIPYPLPWSGYCDHYGSLNIEGALEQQQLGEALNLKTKQHYVQAYWIHFHPLFPVLHPQIYEQYRSNPLLSAAVMAIGAQYTNKPFARDDSRILHQKCQELIGQYKDSLKTTTRLDHLQAVFLVEILSHFKAKRAPLSLSEVFRAVYNQLWDRHNTLHPQSVTRSELDRLGAAPPQADEDVINQQWWQWIIANSFERLLIACYILESYEGLLLVRPATDINRTAAGMGLELYMPISSTIWDARSAKQWQAMLTKAADGDICRTRDVLQTLDDIANGAQAVRLDTFQSSLLIAIQASAIFSQAHGASPYATYTHPIFDVDKSTLFSNSLSQNPYIRLMHEVVLLSASTPFKALLAVSGESWLLSSRLSHEALAAKETFELLKFELRQWVQGLQPLYPTTSIPFANTVEADVPAHRALRHALNILDLSLTTSPILPAFGPEMALYYAALVLWACTYAAPFAAEPSMGIEIGAQQPLELELELGGVLVGAAAAAVERSEGRALEDAARRFVEGAERRVEEVEMGGMALLSGDELQEWRVGVMTMLKWTAWIVGGGQAREWGVGELMKGAVRVLEKLGKKGWDEGWF